MSTCGYSKPKKDKIFLKSSLACWIAEVCFLTCRHLPSHPTQSVTRLFLEACLIPSMVVGITSERRVIELAVGLFDVTCSGKGLVQATVPPSALVRRSGRVHWPSGRHSNTLRMLRQGPRVEPWRMQANLAVLAGRHRGLQRRDFCMCKGLGMAIGAAATWL